MRNEKKPIPTPHGAKTPTLGDVRDAVKVSPNLTPTRIRDLVSAISCFGTLIGEEPDSIPLDLAAIAPGLVPSIPSPPASVPSASPIYVATCSPPSPRAA